MHPNKKEIIKKPLLNLSMLSENNDNIIKLIKMIAILVRARDSVTIKPDWLIKKIAARKA
jgi:hypothetical protein